MADQNLGLLEEEITSKLVSIAYRRKIGRNPLILIVGWWSLVNYNDLAGSNVWDVT